MAEYSIFDYMYRDASNYKSVGSLLLKGRVTEKNSPQLTPPSAMTNFSLPSKLAFLLSMKSFGN